MSFSAPQAPPNEDDKRRDSARGDRAAGMHRRSGSEALSEIPSPRESCRPADAIARCRAIHGICGKRPGEIALREAWSLRLAGLIDVLNQEIA